MFNEHPFSLCESDHHNLNMDEKLSIQERLIERIEKFQKNLKKCATEKRTKGYLLGRLENLHKLWDEFERNNRTIETDDPDEDDDENEDAYGETEELYHSIVGLILDYLDEFEPARATTIRPAAGASQPNPTNPTATIPDFKLPRLELPYFHGEYESWKSFHDIYVAAVHSNTNIPAVQKLQFLKTRLKGEAAGLLDNLPVTDENYTQAWKLLVSRYDNERILVNTQLRILLSQKMADETAEGIRTILDTTTGCIQALKNLDVATDDWDSILLYVVTELLPKDSRQLWE